MMDCQYFVFDFGSSIISCVKRQDSKFSMLLINVKTYTENEIKESAGGSVWFTVFCVMINVNYYVF